MTATYVPDAKRGELWKAALWAGKFLPEEFF
jgi:hypothetical protein